MTDLDYLKSIDATLKALLERMTPADPTKQIASDKDLDSKWGNPTVKFLPRDWTGDNYTGCQFSDCHPDFLDALAQVFDYFAKKAEENNELTTSGKPKAEYNRKDAARARGWAKRIRASGKLDAPAAKAEPQWATDDKDVPF